jgi:hypothetical protein
MMCGCREDAIQRKIFSAFNFINFVIKLITGTLLSEKKLQ